MHSRVKHCLHPKEGLDQESPEAATDTETVAVTDCASRR